MEKAQAIIDIMNREIEHLRAASIQYTQHASLLEGIHMALVGDLKEHAEDDWEQSVWLSEKVADYGGVPTVSVGVIKQSPSSLGMLLLDYQTAEEALQRMKDSLQVFESEQEHAMVKFTMESIEHEEEHLAFLAGYLAPFLENGEISQAFVSLEAQARS